MQIAILGHGHVGGALADQLERAGHAVTIATDDRASESLARLLARNPRLAVAPPREAIAQAAVVFLAIPYQANAEVLPLLADALAGRILVDCTNPVGPRLTHGIGASSGTEAIQAMLPATPVVKAFSVYGYENFEDNRFPGAGVRPVMPFCGDSAEAKRVVGTLIAELGWEPLDVGGAVQALHLEHMTLLWVRMVRMGGRSPHLVWAMLTR